MKYIKFFKDISSKDLSLVGGKNASLGEMMRNVKVSIPDGFAITSIGYMLFLKENNLEKKISSLLKKIRKDKKNLQKIGASIRSLILNAKIPNKLKKEISLAYKKLSKQKNSVAIRSSATAEDLPKASFAGQLESYLNVKGEKEVIDTCIKCYSSLFTDRAIAYRIEKGFFKDVYISVGVQKMVDSESSGVIFTLDTESGFDKVITITASYGLGENIVQGKVIPDEYQVFKPFLNKKNFDPIIERQLGDKTYKLVYSTKKRTKNIKTTKNEKDRFALSEKDIKALGKYAYLIEKHYKKPMDIEWAKDRKTKKLYIVQARPETVRSQESFHVFKNYKLEGKKKPILKGIAIGKKIESGKVQIINSSKEIKKFKTKNILVTKNTTPDWVPIMKKASGIITDHGGRTSHAAIVSRELDIPAIVGVGKATKILKNKEEVTINCSSGDVGEIFKGKLKYSTSSQNISNLKKLKIQVMINIASPSSAFKWWQIPVDGIGLARMEFIISNMIKLHPLACLEKSKITNPSVKKKINEITRGYRTKKEYFVDILSRAIAKIASSQYPKNVILRFSDFKTNEYRELVGGEYFEEIEENPMIGFRGASRYYSKEYIKAFELECISIKKTISMGFNNITLMIPFCRTLKEADLVLKILNKNGLRKSKNLKIYVMCEIPSNVILIDQFSKKFDGISIGSNDLTQLILGVDRDSEKLKDIFDAEDLAVKKAIKEVIQKSHKNRCRVGICGQAPSDDLNFAKFLIENKIDSISLNPDSVIDFIKNLS